jgi:hypothetical protein
MGSPRKNEICPCGGPVRRSLYDLALSEPGAEGERLYFGIPGALCLACGSLSLERDTRIVLGIDPDTTVCLIESDVVLSRDLAA